MPIEFGLWRMDGDSSRMVPSSKLQQESRIEDLIVSDPQILEAELLIIGQQVRTDDGKRIDVLGIDASGDLHIVEVKRDRTPREVAAQAIEYASWVQTLGYEEISDLFEHNTGKEFDSAFAERFDSGQSTELSGPPEEPNQNHSMTIVATELDSSTEKIVQYLSEEYNVPINALFFNYYEDDGREYVARTWLVDPNKAREPVSKKERWNGHDFYVSFGDGEHRSWEDARRYGFVSGGQGRWYSRTLEQLHPGARIFVHIPGEGYVGIGTVTHEAVPVSEFEVDHDGETKPILQAPLEAEAMEENVDDAELCEYLVGVDWKQTSRPADAVWETGLFANQNTVCKLRRQFTIERLLDAFDVDDEGYTTADD